LRAAITSVQGARESRSPIDILRAKYAGKMPKPAPEPATPAVSEIPPPADARAPRPERNTEADPERSARPDAPVRESRPNRTDTKTEAPAPNAGEASHEDVRRVLYGENR
jgi:hypothetical protein